MCSAGGRHSGHRAKPKWSRVRGCPGGQEPLAAAGCTAWDDPLLLPGSRVGRLTDAVAEKPDAVVELEVRPSTLQQPPFFTACAEPASLVGALPEQCLPVGNVKIRPYELV